ncbi:MAG: beta-xylosidase [Bryobacteraceae bacterium]
MRNAFICLLCFAGASSAQQSVTIRIDPGETLGPMKPVWGYFGYDEPNYTYTNNGRKLIGELGALDAAPVYIRTHNLLTTGDATPALKWGSTNAYTEDATGRPIYDWTIVDRIFDTYLNAGAKPFVEIGFMPEALSSHPEPYKHDWPKTNIYTGWSYPPKDYQKWSELVYQWAKHTAKKYGEREAESWYWEVWNEPDIGYWHGTPEEYDKLYDFTAAALKRALPGARVGGPASTGPAGKNAAEFLRQFLRHCDQGGSPLEFITFHAKGSPEIVDGHVRMGLARNLKDVEAGFEIVSEFPKFRDLTIILSESDPEGCAACSAKEHPQNAYRNGPLYASYTAEAASRILELAQRHQANITGMLTWAFEFEDQPYFAGLRTLATNGINKPILNLFRMEGMVEGARVKVESSGALALNDILSRGVRQNADVNAIAAKSGHSIALLAWHYHDDDIAGPDIPVTLIVKRAQDMPGRALLEHYRVDDHHSNAYSEWKQMGSPQDPSPDQYSKLQAAGQLQLLDSPRWVSATADSFTINFALPRESVSLIELRY